MVNNHTLLYIYMQEIWKDIEGYEGLYKVSNLGHVMRLYKSGKTRILKGVLNNDGYYKVTLSKNSKPKDVTIHRLVAIAFIPNPDNLHVVNHKDENRRNNYVGNLEWCTIEYNNNYGTRNKRISKSSMGKIQSEEHRLKNSEAKKGQTWNRGRKCIHKGTKWKHVMPHEIDSYLEKGWELGRK